MSLYAISDLHLSTNNKKSMEVFGDKWADYMNRIKSNWEDIIEADDFIIVPGDISWATYLDESIDDFKFLNSLPGRKLIIKGNHDYWWTTMSKLNEFLVNNKLTTIQFLQNDSTVYGGKLICGTRGWITPEQSEFTQEDMKIFKREVQRLKLSLESGRNKEYDEIIVALHYPPFNSNGQINEIILGLLNEYNVRTCIYGHLHGPAQNTAIEGEAYGIAFKMISSDYLNFIPTKIV